MTSRGEVAAPTCPYLEPEPTDRLGAVPTGVHCRLPGGRTRIPSRDELARFCESGHHGDCPAYRRARYLETVVSGLA